MLAHWDEVESGRAEAGHIAGLWTDLGSAAGTKTVGVTRIRVDPGKWSTPLHRQTGEEEIFFVLAGSGVCLLSDRTFEVGAGDCIVHRVFQSHTLLAGDDGLDVLAFGERGETEAAHLPRAHVSWLGGSWVEAGTGQHPWEREAAAGEPELPELGERPDSVVHVDDVEGDHDGGSWRLLARTAGAERTGLNWGRLPAGEEGAPPHSHSADEEIFVVLDGEGTLELHPSPQRVRAGMRLRGAADSRRPRDLTSRRDGDLARAARRRPGTHLPRLRNEASRRRLLLPALEQDLLPRPGPDRTARGPRLRRRRTPLSRG